MLKKISNVIKEYQGRRRNFKSLQSEYQKKLNVLLQDTSMDIQYRLLFICRMRIENEKLFDSLDLSVFQEIYEQYVLDKKFYDGWLAWVRENKLV
jgi:hypothetical protein